MEKSTYRRKLQPMRAWVTLFEIGCLLYVCWGHSEDLWRMNVGREVVQCPNLALYAHVLRREVSQNYHKSLRNVHDSSMSLISSGVSTMQLFGRSDGSFSQMSDAWNPDEQNSKSGRDANVRYDSMGVFCSSKNKEFCDACYLSLNTVTTRYTRLFNFVNNLSADCAGASNSFSKELCFACFYISPIYMNPMSISNSDGRDVSIVVSDVDFRETAELPQLVMYGDELQAEAENFLPEVVPKTSLRRSNKTALFNKARTAPTSQVTISFRRLWQYGILGAPKSDVDEQRSCADMSKDICYETYGEYCSSTSENFCHNCHHSINPATTSYEKFLNLQDEWGADCAGAVNVVSDDYCVFCLYFRSNGEKLNASQSESHGFGGLSGSSRFWIGFCGLLLVAHTLVVFKVVIGRDPEINQK